ncbi:hypothetical protein C5167_000162 [Papaver somniferum]|uniref:Neprosin PEP catalytic domain-containing protein n=1 Tax=Papaver somniferum TaxID=3469 RepID=A0A4Y7KUR2_PAPSO|nr:uncharacterized protein LOC113308307 [Papaver somniferum]RZC75908.1 hypothetical protein C5167_000162 [Papaver somniferum]
MSFKSLVIELVAAIALFNLCLENYGAEGINHRKISKKEDMEFDRQLKILNKPPVKTIRTEFGDVYDCINIYKQPAFDHPLLRNHKIQMQPNLIHGEQGDEPNPGMFSSVDRYKFEGCPPETVPIRRTTKKDLINAKNHFQWMKQRHYVAVQPNPKKIFYGARARLSVTNPTVQSSQLSTSQIWIMNGPRENLNSIEVGWAVYPELFGDNRTRVFGLWTADGYKEKGCFNTLCEGFVQVHPEYFFGEPLREGTYGKEQRGFDFSVHRGSDGKWWFIDGRDKATIGYWPPEIFTHLKNPATVVEFGGSAGADPGKPYPPMGYGRLPVFDSRITSCMLQMKVVAEQDGFFEDFDWWDVQIRRDTNPSCYDIIFPGEYLLSGLIMLFGGPGGGDCH